MSRTVEDIIEIGRDLISVKATLGHGSFGHWIEAEFGMSAVSASRFINVAERFGGKSFPGKDLPAHVLYTLASPSTDEAVVEEVLERVAEGESITRDDVKALKQEWAFGRVRACDGVQSFLGVQGRPVAVPARLVEWLEFAEVTGAYDEREPEAKVVEVHGRREVTLMLEHLAGMRPVRVSAGALSIG